MLIAGREPLRRLRPPDRDMRRMAAWVDGSSGLRLDTEQWACPRQETDVELFLTK